MPSEMVNAAPGTLLAATVPCLPSFEAFGTRGLKGKTDLPQTSENAISGLSHSLRPQDIVTKALMGSSPGSVKLLNLSESPFLYP